jgi:hypothetical protein
MKAELQKKLSEKYYTFFKHLDDDGTPMIDPFKSIGESIHGLISQKKMVVPMQFGFECEDGWYFLLNNLMGSIQWHIEQENERRDKEPRIKWLDKLSWKLRIRTFHKIKLLKWIGERIYDKQPRGVPHLYFQVNQIKEKFGGLRFEYSGGDDYIDGMVALAESMSYGICEFCGTTKDVGRTEGWVFTICKSCYNKNERAQNLVWHINKDE